MMAAKTTLHNALVAYLDLPGEQKAGASWFVKSFESETRLRGISTHDVAGCLAMVYWVHASLFVVHSQPSFYPNARCPVA